MTGKFRNTYRISSTRLQNWDYGWDAAYFVAICTQNRECFFGKIAAGKMELSNIGIIADLLWHEIKNHAKNIELDAFVVMPNHIHGILILNGNNKINANAIVETRHALSLQQQQQQQQQQQPEKTIGQQRFQNQGKNTISSILGAYKSAVTKHAHRLGFYFEWQTRFHDHIIRNDNELNRIQDYILNNPKNWNNDKFYE